MTSRDHFESWMKHSRPNMPLDWNGQEGYYYHDIVNLMFHAWNEASAEVERLRGELLMFEPVACRWFETKWGEYSYGEYPIQFRSSEVVYIRNDNKKPAEAG